MSESKPPDVSALIGQIRTLAATFAPLVALADLAEWLSVQETTILQYGKRLQTLRSEIDAAERERDERKDTWARAQTQQQTELTILKAQMEQMRRDKETWLQAHDKRLDEVKEQIRGEKETLLRCQGDTKAAEAELARVRAEIAGTLKGLSTMATGKP